MKKLLITLAVLSFMISCNDDPIDETPCGHGRNRCNPDDIIGVRCNDCNILYTDDKAACNDRGGFREYICDRD